MAEFAVQLEDVTVTYPSPQGVVTALRDITLTLHRGSSTAVSGRSGSGKSTLMSVLSLLRRPTSGRVVLGGEQISALDDRRLARLRSTDVGIAFQSFHLEPALSAAENVMLPWYFQTGRRPQRWAREHAVSIMHRMGIGDLADRLPNAMSGGQRQRVAIARAMFTQPTLFVADEPTGNLDEETANAIADMIFTLPARFGTTVVVVTHDRTVAAMAETQLELVRGELGRMS